MDAARWQRIDEVFAAALEQPDGQRRDFLDRACGDDAELRREVESLLANHGDEAFLASGGGDEAAQLLVSAGHASAPDGAPEADDSAAVRAGQPDEGIGPEDAESSAAGRRVGPYVLVREVARGGMGAVYLAERADEQYEKRVAIKLIKRGMDTDALLRQFRHERQILASLDHPNIARLLDGGTTDDGLPYFVMEFIEGVRIDEYCDARRLSVTGRLELFRRVCAAVSYAHQHLVVHRDIKPSNILVTSEGTPKLLDFGIARILHGEGGAETGTQTGARMLTPEYASLEQLQGRRATTLSDVYSLGVVLYELLSGRRPYHFPSREPELAARAIPDPAPAKPSEAARHAEGAGPSRGESPERLRRRLQGDLDTIVLMAIRREPERRYASVEGMSEDIRRHLEGRPVFAREDTFAYRAAKFVRRNKAPVAAAALVFLSLVGGMATTQWQARRARIQEGVARGEQAKAERRFGDVRRLARSLLFDYHDAIKDLPGATPVRARLVKDALGYLDALSKEAGGDLTLQRELAAAYERVGDVQGGSMAANLGDTAGAIESLRKAIALREAVRSAEPQSREARRALAAGYGKLAKLVWETGDLSGALDTVRKGLAFLEDLARDDPGDSASRLELGQSLDLTGFILQENGEHAASLAHLRRSRATLESLPSTGPEGAKVRRALSAVWEHEGTTLQTASDLPGALAANRHALELRVALSAEYPNNADYRRILGISYYNNAEILDLMGRRREALAGYRQSLAVGEELLAQDPTNEQYRSDLPYGLVRIGEVLAALNEVGPAIAHYQRARAMRETEVKADPSSLWKRCALIEIHAKLAKALASTGRTAEALATCDTTRLLMEKTPVEPTNVMYRTFFARTYADLGDAHAALGSASGLPAETRGERWRAARRMYRGSLEIWQDLRARGILGKIDEGKPDEMARAIAKCERRLGSQ